MTLTNADRFWSSTGSITAEMEEWLLYRLKHPINYVATVKLKAYRATYQFG